MLALAGLYELWRNPARPRDDRAAVLWTATHHGGAPVVAAPARPDADVLDPTRYDSWLDPGLTDPAAVRALLCPIHPDVLEAHPVDPAVGNVANNAPHLARPVPDITAPRPSAQAAL